MVNEQKFESWAIVELFGRQTIVGLVSEATIGGCSFLRVDVPASDGDEAYTKFFSNGAVYSMTPIGENVAREALRRQRMRAINIYGIDLVPKALPADRDLQEPMELCPFCGCEVAVNETVCPDCHAVIEDAYEEAVDEAVCADCHGTIEDAYDEEV